MAEAPSNIHNRRSLIRTSQVCHRSLAVGRSQQMKKYKHTHTHTHTNTHRHYILQINNKIKLNSSLLIINLLLKSTYLFKKDSSKRSLHRSIILGKSVGFILFFLILAIFVFISKLKKVKLGFLLFALQHL